MSKVSSGLQIKLLGELTLSCEGTSITGVKSERLQSLLAFLLLHRNTSQSRQQVAVQLWPDVSDTEAKANLRRRLHELKQKLPGGDQWLRVEKTTVQWIQGDNCWLDIAEFEAASESVTSLQTSLRTMTAADVQGLEQAAKLYQGDLLPSCYDDWIEPHRDQLRHQAITVLDALIPQLAEQNQVRAALSYAQQLQRLDPLYEPVYCHLMRLHTQEGDRASALRVYHQCMTRLQDELGVPPSPTTCQIYEELLRQDAMPQTSSGDATAEPPTAASVSFPADISVPGWERDGSGMPAVPPQTHPVRSVRSITSPVTAQVKAADHPTIYIERPPLESLCHDTLLQPGALVRVKSPALMGKTLMMDRILAQLATEQLRTVRISMEMADRKTHFSDLNRFLRWLCINISRLLAIPNQINDYWDEEGMGSKMSCSTYMEEYLLMVSDEPLVVCLDDIDVLFSYPDIYEDFFGLLRSWYEQARTYTSPIWKQLRLAIVHATDVYIPLNINQSPFNVGVPIELPDFTDDQAQLFATQHQVDPLDIAALMEMVGGHPYLLQQAFEHLKRHPEQDLATLLNRAPTDSGIYANHLRDCWLDIRDHPDLKMILMTMMTTEQPVAVDAIMAHQLHSMGVIKLQGNLAKPRCQLYRKYFKAHLDQPV